MLVLKAFYIDRPCFKTGTYIWTDGLCQCEGHCLEIMKQIIKKIQQKQSKVEVKRKMF